MDNRFYKKNALILGIIYTSLTLIVTFYEFTLFSKEYKYMFISLKAGAILVTFLTLIYMWKKGPSRILNYILDFSVIGYCVVGEVYSSLYVLALLQVSLGKVFLLKQSKKDFLITISLGIVSLIVVNIFKYNGIISLPSRSIVENDYWTIVLGFTILIILQKIKFFDSVEKTEIQKERLVILGENINILLHNIKAQFASQMILVDNMKDSINDKNELQELLELANNHLVEVKNYLNSVNKFQNTKIISEQQKETFSIFEVLDESLLLLGLSRTSISLVGKDLDINMNREDILTIFLNVFSNALKTIKRVRNLESEISINLKEGRLRISFDKSHDYEDSSGIGNLVTERLSIRNNIKYNLSEDSKKLTYQFDFQ